MDRAVEGQSIGPGGALAAISCIRDSHVLNIVPPSLQPVPATLGPPRLQTTELPSHANP